MIITTIVTKQPSRYTTKAAAYLLGRHWASTIGKIDLSEGKHPHSCTDQCTCM